MFSKRLERDIRTGPVALEGWEELIHIFMAAKSRADLSRKTLHKAIPDEYREEKARPVNLPG